MSLDGKFVQAQPTGLPTLPSFPSLPSAQTPAPQTPASQSGFGVTGQEQVPAVPQATPEGMSSQDVQKYQRDKQVSDLVTEIRTAVSRQDYQAAKTALDEAEKIDPNASAVRLYKNIVDRKIMEGATGPANIMRTPKAGATGLEQSGFSTTEAPSAETLQAAPTPSASIKPAAETTASSKSTSVASRKMRKTLTALGIVLLLAAAAGIAKGYRNILDWIASKRGRSTAASAPARSSNVGANPSPTLAGMGMTSSSNHAAPPPPPMMFQGLGDSNDPNRIASDFMNSSGRRRDDDAQDAQAIARDIAQNVASLNPPSVSSGLSAGGPMFDLPTAAGEQADPQTVNDVHTVNTAYMDNAPTIPEGDAGDARLAGMPQSFAAPPPVAPEPPKPPAPSAAASQAEKESQDMVSFEDLGIVFAQDPEPQAPPAPPVAANPAPPAPAPARPASAPPQEAPKESGTVSLESLGLGDIFKPDSLAPHAPAKQDPAMAQAASKPAEKADDLTATTPAKNRVPEPGMVASEPAGAIDLQKVLFGANSNAAPPTEPLVRTPPSPSPQPNPAPAKALVLPPEMEADTIRITGLGLDNLPPETTKSASGKPAAEDTYGAYGETFHGQDTIALQSTGPDPDTDQHSLSPPSSVSTPGVPLIDPALSATRSIPGPAHTAPSPPAKQADKDMAATHPAAAKSLATPSSGGSNLDDRSQRMFLEQMDRAHRAVKDKNWRQAVHYLSIAAAIHPDNADVREQLRVARAEKRKDEAGA